MPVRLAKRLMKKLTKAQTAEIQNLAALDDSQIDTQAMPELTAKQLENAKIGQFYKPVNPQTKKRPITQ
jgi:uncharacterized protein YdbL (DUF1318 family)